MAKILVGVDGSPESDKALDYAASVASVSKGELLVINVAEDFCPAGLTEVDCNVVRELAMKGAKTVPLLWLGYDQSDRDGEPARRAGPSARECRVRGPPAAGRPGA